MSSSKTSRRSSSSTSSAKTSVTNPVLVASSLGLANTSWLKVGDGGWSGTVRLDGRELVIEELASSWRASDETGQLVTRKSLEAVLEAVLKGAQ